MALGRRLRQRCVRADWAGTLNRPRGEECDTDRRICPRAAAVRFIDRRGGPRGATRRFRAVMMTAVSFIIGIMPMMFATGAGAQSRRIIGTTVFSGMLVATVIGILFIPSLYVLFQRLREWAHRRAD